MAEQGGKISFKNPDEVETVFYESFSRCDAEVMAALWADGDVICVHPGSGIILGYQAVARSWRHIFTNARMPRVELSVVKRTVTDNMAVHLVTETVTGAEEMSTVVLATNVYQKFHGGWLMIQHHASVIESRQENRTLQ